jgi:molybdopterin/thiamine biosynthesis adenylyltransferase/rhodanese-related sulfurtransferase
MNAMDATDQFGRYHHQLLLRGFGTDAQQKLSDARVLVAGAGGLGCAALQYLAAAGTGTIGIADDDTVELTNLHRQVLYGHRDIGLPKANRAALRLKEINAGIEIQVYPLRLTNRNILGILENFDVIVDGTDNRASKYMINDACVLTGKPFIFGAVSEFEGHVAVFNVSTPAGISANYRDIFPDPWSDNHETGCNDTGVIGTLTGIIGCMQGNEAIKVITGIGDPLMNRMVTYNSLTGRMHEFDIQASPATRNRIPADILDFLQTSYERPCEAEGSNGLEIHPEEFQNLLSRKDITVIDVRENPGPAPVEFSHIHIPFYRLHESLAVIKGETVITFCDRGIVSLKAARLLKEAFQDSKRIYSLRHGINHWHKTNRIA